VSTSSTGAIAPERYGEEYDPPTALFEKEDARARVRVVCYFCGDRVSGPSRESAVETVEILCRACRRELPARAKLGRRGCR
jgi:hypothetical protein